MRTLGEDTRWRMLSGSWIPLSLLLLLLLLAVTEAQSGDGDSDEEPRISCSSHITTAESSLTCKLLGGRNDDDEDDDDIEKMTVCYTDLSRRRDECVEAGGDTVSSGDLNPVLRLNVTLHLKRGGRISTMVDLKKIVKPRRPRVWNVTFSEESNQAVINIQTPYHNDYLKVENQLFQLFIWTTGVEMTQNITASEPLAMRIDLGRLLKNSRYHVKVRAIPQVHLQGSWSEWSDTFSFVTPAGEENGQKQMEERLETHTLPVCLVLLFVVTSSVVFFWKNKIFTYMWPSIPHPKHTLVQICKPNKGLLLNFKPEVFSALKVDPMEKTDEHPCEEAQASISAAAADGTQSDDPCSTQSSGCSRSTTSVSTEELELSALLSRSSSDGESSLQSAILEPEERCDSAQREVSSGGHEAAMFGVSQQEEAYVTMSSFYQIKQEHDVF